MTTRVCVLGYPVGHSRSPAMHNAAFAELGLDWHYEPLEVEPRHFDSVVRGLHERGFVGANVTVPHKLSALALADSASDTAKAVGAANTLSISASGITADNTDVEGFVRALREQVPAAPAGMRALVLGAGGAARAVIYGLMREDAARIAVWNRHGERAELLVEDFRRHGPKTALEAVAEPDLRDVDLLVNATSVGMATGKGPRAQTDDFKQLRISADSLADVRIAVDLVYRHGGTALQREARSRELTCVDGIDILVHQGAASFELWTGRRAPLEVLRLGARTPQNDRPG